MSFNFTRENNSEGKPIITITANNGDVEALDNVMEKYNFINEEAMLRFALIVLLKAGNNGVYVDEDNKRVFVSPSLSILKSVDASSPEAHPPATPST